MSFDPPPSGIQSTQTDPVSATIAARPVPTRMGHLHYVSLLFDLISHVRSLIVPAVLGLFGAAQGNMFYLIISGLIFVPTLAVSIIRYLSLRFCIEDQELVISQGIFFRRIRTVPVERIQNIDLVQNILHRLFRVAEVRVETASGKEPEATLRVLGLRDVELLRDAIFRRRDLKRVDDVEQTTGETSIGSSFSETESGVETMLAIPVSQLVQAGLASNRGMILIGVLFGLFFQFDLENKLEFKRLANLLPQGMNVTQEVLLGIAGLILLLALLRLLGVIWYILRFHGYRLDRSGDDLRISCGLFTRLSATVPRKRIQFISIHRNLLMRWMGLATIRIETAGGAAKHSEDATKSVSSRWFIPVLPNDRVAEILQQLRPGLIWQEDDFQWHPLAPRAALRMGRIAVVVAVLIGIVGFAVTRPWGWAFGVAALPCTIFLAIKKSRAMRYARTDGGVIYRSGVLTRKTSITFFEKIQTLKVTQTPFDRRWQMATLSVDTAAAGPADHTINIRYLGSDFAHGEFEVLMQEAASRQPVFG